MGVPFVAFFHVWKLIGAIFVFFWASPGPGVAGNGLSAKNDSQFKGRDANRCPGDPIRGLFSLMKATPTHANFMFRWFVFPKMLGVVGVDAYGANPDFCCYSVCVLCFAI